MKRKSHKKSVLSKALIKTIPLSLALTLFTTGNASGADQYGKIAVKLPNGAPVTFDMGRMRDAGYRGQALDLLKNAWLNAEPIFISTDGTNMHFLDFSKNARFGDTFADVMARSNKLHSQNTDAIDLASPDDIIMWEPDIY